MKQKTSHNQCIHRLMVWLSNHKFTISQVIEAPSKHMTVDYKLHKHGLLSSLPNFRQCSHVGDNNSIDTGLSHPFTVGRLSCFCYSWLNMPAVGNFWHVWFPLMIWHTRYILPLSNEQATRTWYINYIEKVPRFQQGIDKIRSVSPGV